MDGEGNWGEFGGEGVSTVSVLRAGLPPLPPPPAKWQRKKVKSWPGLADWGAGSKELPL